MRKEKRMIVGLNLFENPSITVITEEDLKKSGVSLNDFFEGYQVVIRCPKEIIEIANDELLMAALIGKMGTPEDLLTGGPPFV